MPISSVSNIALTPNGNEYKVTKTAGTVGTIVGGSILAIPIAMGLPDCKDIK